jgi:hypothetical protein
MTIRLLATLTAISALWLVALANPSNSQAAADCQVLLGNNLYRCQVKSELGATNELCLRAISPGSASTKFDLQFNSFLGTSLGCICKATKTFKAPSFNTSTEFVCGNPQFGDAATGKVGGKGKKIVGGNYFFNGTPNANVFECERDPTCPFCSAGLTLCVSGCSDLTSDSQNCGECGNECAAIQSCVSGVCQ